MVGPWWQCSLAESLERIPDDEGQRVHYPIRHGTMRVGIYAPDRDDAQKPHSQDELYIIAEGSGYFVRGEEGVPCREGEALFVPAGIEHRFEEVSPGFKTWVIFWGPEGGEA